MTITYGYQKPRQLADDLWELTGTWKNKFGRRMTVVRSVDGSIVVHNAFQLLPADLQWLRDQGQVRAIVAPNTFHCSDAGWMKRQFPAAELFVPAAKTECFRQLGLQVSDTARFPNLCGLKAIPMRGTRMQETAFLHTSSRTLILCDLAFNMPPVFTGLAKWFMNWNKVGVRFGPSRLTRLAFATDRTALLDSYQALLREDFDRVIVNHGDVLESGGREKLRQAVNEIWNSSL